MNEKMDTSPGKNNSRDPEGFIDVVYKQQTQEPYTSTTNLTYENEWPSNSTEERLMVFSFSVAFTTYKAHQELSNQRSMRSVGLYLFRDFSMLTL